MAAGSSGKRRFRAGRVALFLVVCGLLYLAMLYWRIEAAGQADECEPADVIIVLGAAQYNGRPSEILTGRLEHALTLYQHGYAPLLLFTGGRQPGDRYTEAEAGQTYALEHGVPADATLLENRGRTTLQSLQIATEIMRRHHLHTAILVSDPFHAFRLGRMAHDLGMQATVSPVANSSVRSPEMQTHYALRELGAYLFYRWFGITG